MDLPRKKRHAASTARVTGGAPPHANTAPTHAQWIRVGGRAGSKPAAGSVLVGKVATLRGGIARHQRRATTKAKVVEKEEKADKVVNYLEHEVLNASMEN